MANLSKIMLPDGTTYDICDTTARKANACGMALVQLEQVRRTKL